MLSTWYMTIEWNKMMLILRMLAVLMLMVVRRDRARRSGHLDHNISPICSRETNDINTIFCHIAIGSFFRNEPLTFQNDENSRKPSGLGIRQHLESHMLLKKS